MGAVRTWTTGYKIVGSVVSAVFLRTLSPGASLALSSGDKVWFSARPEMMATGMPLMGLGPGGSDWSCSKACFQMFKAKDA